MCFGASCPTILVSVCFARVLRGPLYGKRVSAAKIVTVVQRLVSEQAGVAMQHIGMPVEDVAEATIRGLEEEAFFIVTHPTRLSSENLGGMRSIQRSPLKHRGLRATKSTI